MQSAFCFDDCGKPFAYQDPDEDLDWTFNFADPEQGPVLETGETLTTVAFTLTREDGAAMTSESLHNQTNGSTYSATFVTGLILGVRYILETDVTTSNNPPRKYSRSFLLICRNN